MALRMANYRENLQVHHLGYCICLEQLVVLDVSETLHG